MRRNAITFLVLLTLFVSSCTSPRKLDSSLYAAVLKGDLREAENLIEQGAGIEESPDGQSFIEIAIIHNRSNRSQMVSLLLDHGADPDAKDDGGVCPLTKAFLFNKLSPEVLDVLLKYGADLNQEDRNGNTVLSLAISQPVPDPEFVRLFLAKSADPNQRNKKGETALHQAVFHRRSRQTEIVDMLIKNGADVNIKDERGQIALNKAAGCPEEIWIALVEAGSDLTTFDDLQETPLLMAARWNALQAAKLMVQKGADVNAENKGGATALFRVSGAGDIGLVKQIIQKGANVNEVDKWGYTPLHSAAAGYRKDVAAYLISKGARINHENSNGLTPLGYAKVHRGDVSPKGKQRKEELLQYLIKQGAK